ncbi:tryptase-like [Micropterus salmoides]|uniref:tryptase-like n=1 Tax=Micropterus salmoides TaxID=27706 RepID=UPI0018EC7050|nr:tryptase-like [Micropterus salmoides]
MKLVINSIPVEKQNPNQDQNQKNHKNQRTHSCSNWRGGMSLPFPQNLMEVQLPIVGNRECTCTYGLSLITNNKMCAKLNVGGKGICQGDGGGPLVSKQGGRWIQGGITSFLSNRGCAVPNIPSGYTRVSQYQSWINSQITINQPGYYTFMSAGTDGDLSVTCSPPRTAR